MSEFGIGDIVREISTGDIGVIKEKNQATAANDSWWVEWSSGKSEGCCLHIREISMTIIKSSRARFTEEQLAFLDERYGFSDKNEATKPLEIKKYKIRDGYVEYGSVIYWRCNTGYQQLKSNDDWEANLMNITLHPMLYSIAVPFYKSVVYEKDEYDE